MIKTLSKERTNIKLTNLELLYWLRLARSHNVGNKTFFDLLTPASILIDDIIEFIGYPANLVIIVIVELELAGKIIRQIGNQIMRIYE